MPDRLCPGPKGEPHAGIPPPLLRRKKLCPACRAKARRAVNRRTQRAFRARKKRRAMELLDSQIAYLTPDGPVFKEKADG